jgi:hypothetical protein
MNASIPSLLHSPTNGGGGVLDFIPPSFENIQHGGRINKEGNPLWISAQKV